MKLLIQPDPEFNRIDRRHATNAVVTCEIKLFQNCFSFRRRPSEIVLPGIISKVF